MSNFPIYATSVNSDGSTSTRQVGTVEVREQQVITGEDTIIAIHFEGVEYLTFEERREAFIRYLAKKVEFPARCHDCSFFHGQTYNGNPVCCAIHPHGNEDCADFEANES